MRAHRSTFRDTSHITMIKMMKKTQGLNRRGDQGQADHKGVQVIHGRCQGVVIAVEAPSKKKMRRRTYPNRHWQRLHMTKQALLFQVSKAYFSLGSQRSNPTSVGETLPVQAAGGGSNPFPLSPQWTGTRHPWAGASRVGSARSSPLMLLNILRVNTRRAGADRSISI